VTPLIVIAGPTASGKSKLALEVAEKIGAELVNADSQQVYAHFNIGTAKPSLEEMNRVKHHLVSHVDPMDRYSAARFQRDADVAISDIRARNKPVVVVGGTGLYLRMLLHGVVEAPSKDEALRAEFEKLSNEEMHAKLMLVDAQTAQKLPLADRVRIIRALEIFELTKTKASDRRAAHQFAEARHQFQMFILNPSREVLYPAINKRTELMFRNGLIEETKELMAKGYSDSAPMDAVGYVQARAVIDGTMTVEKAIADTAQATRHYAKRQFTWFKKEAPATLLTPPFSIEDVVTQWQRAT
jgi:tRNA dimethylallyltransferase